MLVSVVDITERKRAEEAVKDNERRFRALIENGLDFISLLDPAGNLLWENPSKSNLLGYHFNEYLGHNLFELMHPEDQEWTRQQLTETIKKPGNRRSGVFRLRHADGTWHWVEGVASNFLDDPATGAIVINYRDITERKQAERALRESEERLGLFIEHAPASLAMFDREMRYLAVSRRWLTDYQLGDQDILSCSHYEIFPEIPGRWRAIHRRGLAGEVVRADEDEFVRTNGSVQWLRWEVRPWYGADGDIGGIVVFTEDITQQKRGDLELRNRLAELEAVNEISIALRVAQTTEEMLPLLLDKALAVMNPDAGMIWLADQHLYPKIARGWFEQIVELPLESSDGIAGHVFVSGEAYLTREFACDPRTGELARAGSGGMGRHVCPYSDR